MSGPTKAHLEQCLREVATQHRDLFLENLDLQLQVERLKAALLADRELPVQAPEVEVGENEPGRWQRMKCRLGRHEPHPLHLQKAHPPCVHCGRFYTQ